MSVATSTAIGIAGVAAAGAGAVSSAVAGHETADATKSATQATSDAAANSLAFNKSVYSDTQGNEAPYRAAGTAAVNQLSAGLTDGSLTAGYAPQFSFSGVDQANDPAYQFDLQQGQQAIQRSAAASGGLVSGGALKDLDTFSQGYASNQYQQSYTNALAQYQQAYQQYETTQGNKFNRLSSTAGLGQNAVTQTATSGNAAASTNAATSANAANTIAGLTTAQGTANAGAAFGISNALTGGVNSIANNMQTSSYGGPDENTPTWNPATGQEVYPNRY